MSKSNKNRDRRELVEQMRKQAKADERRRTLSVIAVCVVIALLIVGAAGWKIYQDNKEADRLAAQELSEIGGTAEAAGCTAVQEADATGAGQHTTDPVSYETVPPAFGSHNPSADTSGEYLFTDDRPPVEVLVHNLEHGWTIAWYDESVADDADQMRQLQATADKFEAEGGPEFNMIIAPWTTEDGDPIPEGKHIAFTHWSVHQPTYDPALYTQAEGEIPSFGESQYCSTFSGAALDAFMQQFPYDDAPEGNLWHQ